MKCREESATVAPSPRLRACGERVGVRGCVRREPVGDPAENCADRDIGALLGEDLGERPGGGRGNLEGHLVGFEFGDRFVGGDRFARPLQPFRNSRLGDRLTEARNLYLDSHRGSSRAPRV